MIDSPINFDESNQNNQYGMDTQIVENNKNPYIPNHPVRTSFRLRTFGL